MTTIASIPVDDLELEDTLLPLAGFQENGSLDDEFDRFPEQWHSVAIRPPFMWGPSVRNLGIALSTLAESSIELRASLRPQAADESHKIRSVEAGEGTAHATIYDDYFGIVRVKSLAPDELRAAAAPLFATFLQDLAGVLPVPDDVDALLRFTSTIFSRELISLPATPRAENPDWMPLGPVARWKLGHRVYAFASRAAAAELGSALTWLSSNQPGPAAGCINRAGEHLRAITAAMVHAAEISSPQYLSIVRPSMAAPPLDVELTGGMNLDYRAYKMAIVALVESVAGRTFRALARTSRALAFAIDDLLHVDLVDLERHIELTHRLVGARPALHENPGESAVQTLRAMYVERLRLYGPLLRHGHVTASVLGPKPTTPTRSDDDGGSRCTM